MRDELVSGRLVEYLRRIGGRSSCRTSAADRSPDDRLDEWLARIPAARNRAPRSWTCIPASSCRPGEDGRWHRRLSLRITNVGLPAAALHGAGRAARHSGSELLPGQDGRPFQTIERTEMPVEIELPETDRAGRYGP